VRVSQGMRDLGEVDLQPFGMGGRLQATFYWVWETQGLKPGDHLLTFSILPGGYQWNEKFTLLPAAGIPAPEPGARWKSISTACCVLHYLSGTEAEQDLETLKAMTEAQAVNVESRFGEKLKGQVPITFMPRVLGHGGFTSDGIYVSYLSQNYAGDATAQVIHHEIVHWLDSQQNSNLRPDILKEGLAVYLSDGHFKKESLRPRAAALIDLGWYLPLRQLVDSFYTSQHEIGYLQAAALIDYLVTVYGWDGFNAFYRDLHSAPGGTQSEALETALKIHFEVSLAELEKDFITFLRQQAVDDLSRTDLRLTVTFYETVRRYQRELDPSAYFLNAWLPNVPVMRQRGITADLLRRPTSVIHRRIEDLLVSGDANLRAGNYAAAEMDLRTVNLILDFFHYWKSGLLSSGDL